MANKKLLSKSLECFKNYIHDRRYKKSMESKALDYRSKVMYGRVKIAVFREILSYAIHSKQKTSASFHHQMSLKFKAYTSLQQSVVERQQK